VLTVGASLVASGTAPGPKKGPKSQRAVLGPDGGISHFVILPLGAGEMQGARSFICADLQGGVRLEFQGAKSSTCIHA
jgi:hypothetical protein